jgi:predicted  nucleic acid-binding Zn ribbon protein
MHTATLNFSIHKKGNRERQVDGIYSLLGALRMNGQILGTQHPIAMSPVGYTSYVNTPEKSSLANKNSNNYVKLALELITDIGLFQPIITIIGKEPECSKLCSCTNSSSYFLYTTYITLESPIKCGTCFGVVPLYKIPKQYEEEYYNIICWQSDYQSCDSLQMNSTVGERFATNQLSNISSKLTTSGLEVCESIRKASKKDVYYYLYKGSGRNHTSELSRLCPNCNGSWFLEKSIHNIFNFMCKKCHLLSNIAWNCQ